MSRERGTVGVVTPEGIALNLDIAGVGSRGIAMIIDMIIQFIVFLLSVLMLYGVQASGTVAIVFIAILYFILFWGYFPLFEWLWHGRTPGKRTQRLRVVRSDGHPMTGLQVVVRNLLRIVDFLPAYYAVGIVSIFVTRRSQRLGDLAAGTIVIREPKAQQLSPLAIMPPPPVPVAGAPVVDVSGMNERHYQLVRSFLQRRTTLSDEARRRLAQEVCAVIRPIVMTAEPMLDETFIERVATAYQARFTTFS